MKILRWILFIPIFPFLILLFFLTRYLARKQDRDYPFCLILCTKLDSNSYMYKYAFYKNNYYTITVIADNPFVEGRPIRDALIQSDIFDNDFDRMDLPHPSGLMTIAKFTNLEKNLYGLTPEYWQKNLDKNIELNTRYIHEYLKEHHE